MKTPKERLVPLAEFAPILTPDWEPFDVQALGGPSWIRNLPQAKVVGIYASGSNAMPGPGITEADLVRALVGGYDVIRHAEPKDGVAYNRDHYDVWYDASFPNHLVVTKWEAPFPGHHADTLPGHLQRFHVVPAS